MPTRLTPLVRWLCHRSVFTASCAAFTSRCHRAPAGNAVDESEQDQHHHGAAEQLAVAPERISIADVRAALSKTPIQVCSRPLAPAKPTTRDKIAAENARNKARVQSIRDRQERDADDLVAQIEV